MTQPRSDSRISFLRLVPYYRAIEVANGGREGGGGRERERERERERVSQSASVFRVVAASVL